MKRTVIGLLANVDAGKTTLTEALLFHSGMIRSLGRVDMKDSFLDGRELERKRGITIFSKQARIRTEEEEIILIDTPGHTDFSAEMERTLQILDYGVLIISARDGLDGRTVLLFDLLKRYRIPCFIFINKLDQDGTVKDEVIKELKQRLTERIVDFTNDSDTVMEDICVNDEKLMEEYLENGSIDESVIEEMINEREIFPCFSGSALKLEGTFALLEGLRKYTVQRSWPDEFSARVYKIERDPKGNRLTFMKITGGSLKNRDVIEYRNLSEKVTDIRLYSADRFESVPVVEAGDVCAVQGLTESKISDTYGKESSEEKAVIEPVMNYSVILPKEMSPMEFLPMIKELEEEDPLLNVRWNEQTQELQVSLMGDIQTEILKNVIKDRFAVSADFGEGKILYRETVDSKAEGIGHFEPLRHYAEVHVLIEPGERGSGISAGSVVSEDELDRNWQRLIMTHILEKKHLGVLTGSPLTDVKITICRGRAHKKHTVGGDFRQATYRAIRQGLMHSENVLLEPYYSFTLLIPSNQVGRAMNDVEKMHGSVEIDYGSGEKPGFTLLKGRAPVSEMRGYYTEVQSYSRGSGRLDVITDGYDVCHNQDEVVKEIGYNPDLDFANPSNSIFCTKGSGTNIYWDEVQKYMHLESYLNGGGGRVAAQKVFIPKKVDRNIGTDEVEKILERTSSRNRSKKKEMPVKPRPKNTEKYVSRDMKKTRKKADTQKKDRYLLIDGYNIIFAWKELKILAEENIDSSREKLTDMIINYSGTSGFKIMLVFDAYRVKGHEVRSYENAGVITVFTREAQSADQYIEKFAFDNRHRYDITVATSDYVEQIIVAGQGAKIISARELKALVDERESDIKEALDAQHDELNTIEKYIRERK